MSENNFLSITDLSPADVVDVVERGLSMKRAHYARPLKGKTIAMLFEKPSLRTRVSFEVGIRQLGGECIYLSQSDVGLGVREPVADVARVLDRWVDGVVARVFAHESLVILAQHIRGPVVNALSEVEHPCQAIADLITVLEHRGKLEGVRVAYVGDGNNVAASLALACASVGADFVIASPHAYRIPDAQWREAETRAGASHASVEWFERPEDAVRDADVVYTDVRVSMGQETETAERETAFKDYRVGPALMEHAKPDAIFMHDLPAKEGKEIEPGMLDFPRSVVFDQAENRLHGQKAILHRLYT